MDGRWMAAMTEATVQQPATTTREQIWLNREQVRKEKPVYRALKRVQDVFFSLLALIVLSPLMLIVALAIVIDDPKGSPIFTQVRSGIDGKEFRIHKFRSMCVDAEAKLADLKRRTEMNGPIFKQKDDPRITRVGRFIRKCGIDELPQLGDILVGSMSIVGPRPPLPCEVAAYTDYERQRLYVRPGLTCIWQIQPNRNDVTFDEWMDMDMRYIRDRSFLLDWKMQKKSSESVCAKDVTTLFSRFILSCFQIRGATGCILIRRRTLLHSEIYNRKKS